jgi:hypothetical protein
MTFNASLSSYDTPCRVMGFVEIIENFILRLFNFIAQRSWCMSGRKRRKYIQNLIHTVPLSIFATNLFFTKLTVVQRSYMEVPPVPISPPPPDQSTDVHIRCRNSFTPQSKVWLQWHLSSFCNHFYSSTEFYENPAQTDYSLMLSRRQTNSRTKLVTAQSVHFTS